MPAGGRLHSLQRRDRTRRDDVRGAAAAVGRRRRRRRPDHGDRPSLIRRERQRVVSVLEQRGARLGDLGRGRDVRRGGDRVGRRARRRIVEQVEAEHRRQDARDRRVHDGARDLAGLHGGQQRSAVVGVLRLLLIGTVEDSAGVMKRAVVGGDEAREPPVLLQRLVLQQVVLTLGTAVDRRVGAHHRGGVGAGDRRLEGGEVELVQRPLADDLVVRRGVAVGLLVVVVVVFDLGELPLALDAVDLGGRERAAEERVLAERLKRPSPARIPIEVDRRSEVDRGSLAALLVADHLAVLASQRRGERRGQVDAGGQLRDAGEPVGNPGGAVLLAELRDAQARDRGLVEDVGVARAVALDEVDLVRQGHLRHQLRDPGRDRLGLVQPRTCSGLASGGPGVPGRGSGGPGVPDRRVGGARNGADSERTRRGRSGRQRGAGASVHNSPL